MLRAGRRRLPGYPLVTSPTEPPSAATVRSVVDSTAWLLGGRLIRLVVGAALSIWVARFLRPADFGLLVSAIALVSVVGAVARLGLNPVVVRDLVRRPEAAPELLNSVVGLRLAGALLGFVVVVAFGSTIVEAPRAGWVFALAGLALFPTAVVESLQSWFQSRIRARVPTVMSLASFLVASLARVGLLVQGASVLWFAAIPSLAGLASAIGLTRFFLADEPGGLSPWHLRRSRIARLLRENWPLAVSQVAGIVALRIDQVMVAAISGVGEAGVYGAALRLSEVWYFVPGALFISLRPALTRLREVDRERYLSVLQGLFSATTLLAVCLALPLTFLSRPIVDTLYGRDFSGAGPVLSIHIWTALLVFWRGAQVEWQINEGHLRFIALRSLVGAASNVTLNLVLIPSHGAVGAAVATLISKFLAIVVTNLFFPPARKIFRYQMRSLLLLDLRRNLRAVARALRGARRGGARA